MLDAVVMSPPAIAIPFDVFHPAGSPSVVMIAHGFPDNAIGNVIVDNPFVLKNIPHCLKTDCNPQAGDAAIIFGCERKIFRIKIHYYKFSMRFIFKVLLCSDRYCLVQKS